MPASPPRADPAPGPARQHGRAALAHAGAHRGRDLAPAALAAALHPERHRPHPFRRRAGPDRRPPLRGRGAGDRHGRGAAAGEGAGSPAARLPPCGGGRPGAAGDRRGRAGAAAARAAGGRVGHRRTRPFHRPSQRPGPALRLLRRIRAVVGHRADAAVGDRGDGGRAAGRRDRCRRCAAHADGREPPVHRPAGMRPRSRSRSAH